MSATSPIEWTDATARRVRATGDLFHGRVPAGAVYVGRPAPGLPGSRFTNPHKVGCCRICGRLHDHADALAAYTHHLDTHPELVAAARLELAGVDLACWCPPDTACHADVLLHRIRTGVLIATIGPPAAGKSTWCRPYQHAGATVVSLDRNRAVVSCCSANQAATADAVLMARADTTAVLAKAGTVVWDATNADRSHRISLLDLAGEYAARTIGVVLLPPLPDVVARNARRDARPCRCGYARRVPDEAIRSMHQAIQRDLPTLRDEGWHHVVEVAR
jgi:predicted kinase